MPKTTQSKNEIFTNQTLVYVGVAIYLLSTALFSFTLFNVIEGFDFKLGLMVHVIALFVGGLGLAHNIASKATSKAVSVLGTLSLAVLFVFPGFLFVVALGWFIGSSHV